MKRPYIGYGIIGIAVAMIVFGILLLVWNGLTGEVVITDEAVEVQNAPFNHGNNRQSNASVLMTAWNGRLYFYIPDSGTLNQTAYDRKLCVFQDGSIRIVRQFDKQVLAMKDGLIYLHSSVSNGWDHSLYCYDIATNTETELTSFLWADSINHRGSVACIMPNGTLYLRSSSEGVDYYPIDDNRVGEESVWQETYQFGKYRYTVTEDQYGARKIERMEIDNSASPYVYDLPVGRLNVISRNDGLLLHNEMFGDLLYYIEGKTGRLVTLFTVECARSVSAVNVHGFYAYLSFRRYEKDDTVFAKPYDNDTLTGTYRIDLRDYSAVKISSGVYDGLYIFDDSGIFACNEKNDIYKLDFDGNVITEMFIH